jgi:1-acyl-sn-glycerol-3-phosphate acyltransferase
MMGVNWIHPERVPMQGGFILAPNHRSYFDPPIAGCGFTRELHFFAKAELFDMPILGSLVREMNSIPVRRGEADRRSLAMAIAAVKEGGGLVLFPEGTRSKTDTFLEPKLGVGMIAARSGKPVVPVYIEGTQGNLAGTMLSAILRRRRIRVIYGHPVMVTSEASDRNSRYREMSEQVMAHIAGLRDELREMIEAGRA